MNIVQDANNIVTSPIVDDLDLKHLFLLTGAVMVFTALWALILAHLKTAAMEIIE